MWRVGITSLGVQCLVCFVLSFERIKVSENFDKECYGTNVGFGFSGGKDFHYDSIRRRYTDCTYVIGNMEITFLDSADITYDLSFLSNIRVVTGYVLLGIVYVEQIPLHNLRLIRADNTYSLMGENYGLVVALTTPPATSDSEAGLVELEMPSLREISHGKVIFIQNHKLKFVDTIEWQTIVPGKEFPVSFLEDSISPEASNCSDECEVNGVKRCWGEGRNMCQEVNTLVCHPSCPGRCYDEEILGCCHPECAIGCWGPNDYDCEMCKYFRDGTRCVSACPEKSYSMGQECVHF